MLRELLNRLERGELAEPQLAGTLRTMLDNGAPRTAETSSARVDLDRWARCGFPEVVYAEGKTVEAVVEIFEVLSAAGQPCLATRVSDDQAAALLSRFPEAISNRVARTVRLGSGDVRSEGDAEPDDAGYVVVVTAGTGDRPVAEEAVETLAWMGCRIELLEDVGVAGPHRLVEQRDRLAGADAVVVVAGMEGALPSVVGGWVDCPVVAVPTSVGYGAGFGGLAALLGMLNSCAANVSVVNIDAGFKGGYVAGVVARRAATARADRG